MIYEIQSKALSGKSAHLSVRRALEGLKLDVTGKKILNTPYTIWQLLNHMNYWQQIWMSRLQGEAVAEDSTWENGWKEELNANSQEELDLVVANLLNSIRELKTMLGKEQAFEIIPMRL